MADEEELECHHRKREDNANGANGANGLIQMNGVVVANGKQ